MTYGLNPFSFRAMLLLDTHTGCQENLHVSIPFHSGLCCYSRMFNRLTVEGLSQSLFIQGYVATDTHTGCQENLHVSIPFHSGLCCYVE